MRTFTGISGAWNYTIGPAIIYRGPETIDQINLSAMPYVVVANTIPLEDIGKIDLHHVYGFVLERGGYGDPARVFYSNQHRATVMKCEGIMEAVQTGDRIVIDGVDAKVFLHPDEATVEEYEEKRLKGPPPEPEGFTDELIRAAMEMATIDPQEMSEAIIDFAMLGRAVELFTKMSEYEVLSAKETKEVKEMVKGTKYEEEVAENVDTYQEAAKVLPIEDRVARLKRQDLITDEEAEALLAGEDLKKKNKGRGGDKSRRRDS
jgi:hypothetical protein